MTDAEFLRRFDAHLEISREHIARGNEIMERNRVAFERFEAAVDRSTEASERHARQHADLRTFIRDITRRNEVVWRGVIDEIAAMRDETRAQTAAILRLLDRFGPGPEPTAG
jgi:hypothetical protein